MRLEMPPLDAVAGHILCHNLADAQGRKAFAKGRVVRAEDLPRLSDLGLRALRVAVLAPGDVHEDEAARRLAYLDPPGGAGPPLPVLGAPSCVRSRDANIVDLLLPRLMAGEQLRRRDIVALGHGGLLGSQP